MIFADIPIFGAQEVITPRSPSAADIPAGMGESRDSRESHDDSGMHLLHGNNCNLPGMHTRLGTIAIVWALNVGGCHLLIAATADSFGWMRSSEAEPLDATTEACWEQRAWRLLGLRLHRRSPKFQVGGRTAVSIIPAMSLEGNPSHPNHGSYLLQNG